MTTVPPRPPVEAIPRRKAGIASSCRRVICGTATAVGLLAACDEQNTYAPPPPPTVAVERPARRPITRYLEVTGSAAAVSTVDLVARVQGFLQAINYQDGALVRSGTILFIIEPEPYRLKLEQAKAAEVGAQASLTQLEAEYQRQAQLGAREYAAKSSVDQALAARDSARAGLQQAQVPRTRTGRLTREVD